MNKDLELSMLRNACKNFGNALRTIRQEAHDAWGTTVAQHTLKRIERTAAHALDYTTVPVPDSPKQHKPELPK